MKDLAPNITRQRLLIEGLFTESVDEEVIKDYFVKMANSLKLKMYADPIIFSPSGMGKDTNQGFDAFVPLVDSGISLYVWSNAKFLSVLMYTCKEFSVETAKNVTKSHFGMETMESETF